MFKKITNKLTALLLCLVTAIGCSLAVMGIPKTAFATSGEGDVPNDDFINYYVYDEEALEQFIESSYNDSYMQQEGERLHYKYESYITYDSQDSRLLNYDELPMYKQYPEVIQFDYENNPYEIKNDDEFVSALSKYGFQDYEIESILEERYIVESIDLMNGVVLEEYGYIEDDTLIITYDPYFEEAAYLRWKAWGFKITWYQLSVNFDSDFAFVFSLIFITGSIFAGGLDDIIDILKSENTDELFDSIKNIIEEKFYNDFVELINGEFIDFVLSLISEIDNVIGKSAIFKKVVVFLLKRMMPPVTDCIIIFLNSIYKGKGMYLAFCWIPWKGKFGFTIRSI